MEAATCDAASAVHWAFGPRHRSGRVDAAELRHSFVSALSDAGVPLEEVSRLVGHSGTTVTELVNRRDGAGPTLGARTGPVVAQAKAGEGLDEHPRWRQVAN
jgi:hypothetical protein